MHAHTRRIHDLATTCTACTCCPTYANLLEHPCSIRASPPPILKFTNQILFPPDREIPLVYLQSANQILFPPVREIRLVRMHLPAFTPITLCTTGRPQCWHMPCTCCPTYTNLLEPSRSIRAFPPPILQSSNQILFPPNREIPLVYLQSINQILFPPDREIPLVYLQSANQILFFTGS